MIILKKDDTHFSYKINKYQSEVDGSLIKHLSSDIIIENGVTFGQFFNIILNYHEEYSKFFHSYLNGVSLEDFISEWNSKSSGDDSDIRRLLIRWPDRYVFDSSNIIDDRSIPEFIGEGDKITNYLTETFSLEFTPLYKLKKYNLMILEDYNIYNDDSDTPIVTLHRDITVFDVLSAIFTEITYAGSPKDRDAELKKIKNRLYKSISNTDDSHPKSISLREFLKKYNIDLPKK